MRWPEDFARRVRAAGLERKHLAAVAGVSRPTVHAVLSGKDVSPTSQASLEAAVARIAAVLRPQGPEEHHGLNELAADHQLLTALGVRPEELQAVAEFLPTKQAALVILQALRLADYLPSELRQRDHA